MKSYTKSNGALSSLSDKVEIFSNTPTGTENGEIYFYDGDIFQNVNGTATLLTAGGGMPSEYFVGDIIASYSDTNPDPTKYLLCDGSTFSQSDWPELYTLLGTNTLPNLHKRYLKGAGQSSVVPTATTVTLKGCLEGSAPKHCHKVSTVPHCHGVDWAHRHEYLYGCCVCTYCCIARYGKSGYAKYGQTCCMQCTYPAEYAPGSITSYPAIIHVTINAAGQDFYQKSKTVRFYIRGAV